MWEDDIGIIDRDGHPYHWVLTVRKCKCGQTLFWDNKTETFHCLKTTCNLNKSHVKPITENNVNRKKIKEWREYNTPEEISVKFRIPLEQVKRLLKE